MAPGILHAAIHMIEAHPPQHRLERVALTGSACWRSRGCTGPVVRIARHTEGREGCIDGVSTCGIDDGINAA